MIRISRNGIRIRIGRSRGKGGRIGVAAFQHPTGLEKATGTIKRELGKKLTMYKIPDLTFIKDESIEYGNKIDEMLRNLERKD